MEKGSKAPVPGYTEVLGHHADNPPEERRSGEHVFEMEPELDDAGAPLLNDDGTPRLRATGVVWTVSGDEAGIKAQFEQHIRQGGRRAVEEERGRGLEAYRTAVDVYQAARAAGRYNWDGDICTAALNSAPGMIYLFYLLLRRCHRDMIESRARQIFADHELQCMNAVRWAVGNWRAPKRGAETNGTVAGPRTTGYLKTDTTRNLARPLPVNTAPTEATFDDP